MTEFYVDTEGLNDLQRLILRVSEDAGETVRYTKAHCDLAITAEGYIMVMLGPHAIAYAAMVIALQKLESLSSGTATQISRAQTDYRNTDAQAAARLDATYSGSTDLNLLHDLQTTHRPDLWPSNRQSFADVAEPTSQLKPPSYITGIEMWSINPLADLISPSAWVRQVSIWLFDYDPFEAWAKQFSGDWNAYVHCAVAWGHIAAACTAMGQNLAAGAADVAAVWRGNAAEGEQEYQVKLGIAATQLAGACLEYRSLYIAAAEATKKLFNVVSGLMSQLIDLLVIINAASAVGTATVETVVGPIAGYGVAAFYVYQAYNLYQNISKFFGNADNTINALAGAVAAVQARMSVDDLPQTAPYRHPAGYR